MSLTVPVNHYSGVRNQQNSTRVLFNYPMLIHARAAAARMAAHCGARPREMLEDRILHEAKWVNHTDARPSDKASGVDFPLCPRVGRGWGGVCPVWITHFARGVGWCVAMCRQHGLPLLPHDASSAWPASSAA